jgi:hypothetical protein
LIWEDYKYLDSSTSRNRRPSEPLSAQQLTQLIKRLAECPVLLKFLHAYLWAYEPKVYLTEMRHLLNVTWDELRATLCPLRPILGENRPNLLQMGRALQNSTTAFPPNWRANISLELACGCLRVRKEIESGFLPEALWCVGRLDISPTLTLLQGQLDPLGSFRPWIAIVS